MMQRLFLLICVACLALGFTARPQAADQGNAQPAAKPAVTGLMVEIVIARYQGEKRLSSLPYTISVNANDNQTSRLRMGAQVPVYATGPAGADGKPTTSYQYRDVGTSIDCSANSHESGGFRLSLTIDDTSVYEENIGAQGAAATGSRPAFRSFRSTNQLVLRNGQTTEFTTATDRITGEVVKVSIKLTVHG